ncbi:MAG TPA: serine/threonine-protein kinase [Polyangiales bacterium]|nr:serine/threonine-protein kinase [Polyangiales bacterium]
MEGRTLGQQLGRYQQVATLGQGGMGTVYLALASGFGQFRKLLVIKELRQDLTRQKGFIRLFMDEAKLAARLSHPNVVQTFEAFQDGNRYLLAMEYLDGQSLSALITRFAGETSRELKLGVHIHILCEVLCGLHYAHELRDYDNTRLHVVHRDVSPQNVFLTYHGEVKVVDFGVAKAANAATSTAPGVFVGKFSYAAPEQILGRPVDPRTDVFAVGVMLWQALAQRRFSTASPTPEAFRARADGSEPRIREVAPEVDPELADICDRAMATNPEDRFPTAQAFRTALQDYMDARNMRVHDADLGALMQQVFEEERAALHAQIEAAVQASGTESNVEALAFLTADKEQTAVADLSNLVDVSVQRDEHKLRQAYANTKISRMASPSVRSGTIFTLRGLQAQRLRWAAIACSGVAAAAGVIWALRAGSGPEPEIKPLAPALVTTKTAPMRVQRMESFEPLPIGANTSTSTSVAKPRPPSEPRKPAPVAPPQAAKPAAPAPQRRPKPPREAPRPEPEPVHVAAPEPPPSPAKPEPARPTRVEAGSDLGTSHRAAPARLDFENPYQ